MRGAIDVVHMVIVHPCALNSCIIFLSCLCARFEVGVRVEGYAVGEERRHINSAFFIFRTTDESVILPKLVPNDEVYWNQV